MATKHDPVPVPAWLWSLAARLYDSARLGHRAMGLGLLLNRVVKEDAERRFLHETFEPWFIEWVKALSDADLEEIEYMLGQEICHMHEWLGRLVRERFPEGDLIAFACARELLEAANCVLVRRDRQAWVVSGFKRLDMIAITLITNYADPLNEPDRNLFIRRSTPLLHLARDRGAKCWWGILADPD